jgi:hypothetical protein
MPGITNAHAVIRKLRNGAAVLAIVDRVGGKAAHPTKNNYRDY